MNTEVQKHIVSYFYIEIGLGAFNMLIMLANVSKEELEHLKSFQLTLSYTLVLFLQMLTMCYGIIISTFVRGSNHNCDSLRNFKKLQEGGCFDWIANN